MMNFFFNRRPLFPIREALACYKANEFNSPTRSTVALLSWLKQEPQMVHSVLRALGVVGEYDVHLEYQVPPQQGQGPDSQTDLMVIAQETALAIEAKWTEGPYETVEAWHQHVNPINGPIVLQGWLNLLQGQAGGSLNVGDFAQVTYQTIHRAASACASGRQPVLAYLLFTPSARPNAMTAEEYADDLDRFHTVLGRPANFPFFLVQIHQTPTPAFDALVHHDIGAQEVMNAIASPVPLFVFREYSVRRIG